MAFSLFGKPFGYAAGGQVQAPRTTNVRGQHHKLAYINNEEEALLRARGGTGQAGPGGIPAFPPVKGKTQGKSNAGTGFSGGSGGGSSSSSSNNNSSSSSGGNPGDQASGGYGNGNSGGNAGSSPPSSPPSGPSQEEINEQNRINRERAQAEADRREAQDQALRDQIEEDRRMQRNRDIVAQQQQQPPTSYDNWLEEAQNVGTTTSDGNNFVSYQVASTGEDAFDSAVEQSLAADKKEAEKARLEQAGFTIQGENVRDANGAFVGKLSDPLGKLMAGGTGYSDYEDYKKKFGEEETYSNYEDYLKSNPPAWEAKQDLVPQLLLILLL